MTTDHPANSFSPTRADDFANRLLTMLNQSSVCVMISIGHRTGLFDTMSKLQPSSSAEIASKAGLDERYVREWLGAMVTGGVVELDPNTYRFSLPAENAAALTRAAGANNMSVFAQYIGVMGSVEDDIVECFYKGGGVPYSRFPRFHEVMAEDSGQSVLSSLESHILPLVPGLSDQLADGIQMLDAGCGRGLTMIRLAELFPKSRFTGIDLSSEAVMFAWKTAADKKLRNIEFIVADLSKFDQTAEVEAFDLITTFDAVHDQKFPLNLLKGIHRALRPSGVYLMQDIKGSSQLHKNIDHPIGPFLYTVSCMHCMTVSLAQGGEGVGAMWGEEMTRDYLQKAGFRSVQKHELAHDVQNNWYVVRK
jgi:ubiquinone/menaquinone biosynthesis C-methylase UbiE